MQFIVPSFIVCCSLYVVCVIVGAIVDDDRKLEGTCEKASPVSVKYICYIHIFTIFEYSLNMKKAMRRDAIEGVI